MSDTPPAPVATTRLLRAQMAAVEAFVARVDALSDDDLKYGGRRFSAVYNLAAKLLRQVATAKDASPVHAHALSGACDMLRAHQRRQCVYLLQRKSGLTDEELWNALFDLALRRCARYEVDDALRLAARAKSFD